MEMTIDRLIYFYIFICISLLAFNLLYIMSSGHILKIRKWRVEAWKRELTSVLKSMEQGNHVHVKHKRRLERKLKLTAELIAYNEVIQEISPKYLNKMENYFEDCREVFQLLVFKYKKKDAIGRGFICYLISVYYSEFFREQNEFREVFLSYLEDSTVYCRENVLHVLYCIGDAGVVEKAFSLFNERGWYHDSRLIADGMDSFAGDKEALVWRLWHHMGEWDDEMIIAVIRFASRFSGVFSKEFLSALENERTPLEIRFELLRYFKRWPYDPAKDFIIKSVLKRRGDYERLAIVASDVIAVYAGQDTKKALKKAVCSRNWYIRHNAASSLVSLGISESEMEEIREYDDLYAIEMLEYMIHIKKERVVSI